MLRYALLGLTVWQFPFCPFFPSRRNPILPTWKSPVAILFFVFLCSGSPWRFLLVPWEAVGSFGACVFLLCFVFSFPVLFFRVVLIFFWLCAWKDSRLLIVAEDPGYLISCRGFLFLLDVSSSGLQASWAFLFFCGPFAPASLDLACFSFWAWLTLLGLSHCDPFRPQQSSSIIPPQTQRSASFLFPHIGNPFSLPCSVDFLKWVLSSPYLS